MEKKFIEKMLHWKPEFGNKKHRKVINLRNDLDEELAKKEPDLDIVDKIIKSIKFYL